MTSIAASSRHGGGSTPTSSLSVAETCTSRAESGRTTGSSHHHHHQHRKSSHKSRAPPDSLPSVAKLRIPSREYDSFITNLTFDPDEDEVFTVIEVPLQRPFVGISDQYGTCFLRWPLMPGVIGMAVAFLLWGTANISEPFIWNKSLSWYNIADLIVGSYKIILGGLGLTATFGVSPGALYFLSLGVYILIISEVVLFLTKWLEWGLALSGFTSSDGQPWHPSMGQVNYMWIFTLLMVLMVAFLILWGIGWVKSLQLIRAANGTGWEKLNYVEILEKQGQAQIGDAPKKKKRKKKKVNQVAERKLRLYQQESEEKSLQLEPGADEWSGHLPTPSRQGSVRSNASSLISQHHGGEYDLGRPRSPQSHHSSRRSYT